MVPRGESPLSHPLSLKVSINCRGLLTSTSGHILAQDQPLMSTPEKPTLHPMDKPTSLHLLLSLSSSLPLLSENSILGRTFRTHAFLSSFGEANTLRGISMRVFDYTLGVGFVGKLWEVRLLKTKTSFYIENLANAHGYTYRLADWSSITAFR